MRAHLILMGTLCLGALVACEEGETGAGEEEMAAEETTEARAGEGEPQAAGEETGREPHPSAVVELATTEPYGEHLVGPAGRPLYMFTADTQGRQSTCYDRCAEVWPPMLTEERPQYGDQGVRQELLGTVERRGGGRHVTYNGWPLYYYARDQGREISGQDVHGFGGEWYLIGPDGEPIEVEEEGTQAK
jgi:predicted lipoprotein with Yx(FWY)xxD motif